MRRLAALLMALTLAAPMARAQGTPEQDYVEANLLAVFYHEFGHALIDLMALPVFGQEEDAADTASILLIDAIFAEDTAQAIARDAAFGFLDEAQSYTQDPAWWDVHGPDLQRYYNLVCLFYGADPELRDDLAEDLGLPQDRAETCAEEFALANDSWGPVLDDIYAAGAGQTLDYQGGDETLTQQLIKSEVAALNSTLTLPAPLTIRVESCGEANAFYDPNDRSIAICTEFEDHLFALFAQNN